MLDAHADEALGNGDGVLRDELLEGDEEAGLDGDAAGDGGAAAWRQYSSKRGCMGSLVQHNTRDRWAYIQRHRLGGDDIAGQVEQEAQQVGDHSHEQDELGKLLLPPCALQVASAVKEGCAIDDQAGEVLLDDGSQGEDPGIDDGLAWHDGQVGHAIAHADQRLLDLLDPVRVGAQDEVEQREEDGGCQQAARDGRQVDAGHGNGMVRCGAVQCGAVRAVRVSRCVRQGQTFVAVACSSGLQPAQSSPLGLKGRASARGGATGAGGATRLLVGGAGRRPHCTLFSGSAALAIPP